MTTNTPKGVNSARSVTGNDSTFIYAPIANGYNAAIGEGDPVKISAGVVKLATNDGIGVAGIFRGVEYIDSTSKKYVIKPNWVAATSSGGTLNGDTRALAKIEPVSGKRFIMRTNAAVSLASTVIGNFYAVSAIGSVDATYGKSLCVIDSSAAVSVGVAMVQVVGLFRETDNKWGDAPTAVEVVFPTKNLV
jgi:hypothetical protein